MSDKDGESNPAPHGLTYVDQLEPGITRKELAVALLRRGCREFQGELLAKPMPLAALTQLILAPARPAPIQRAG